MTLNWAHSEYWRDERRLALSVPCELMALSLEVRKIILLHKLTVPVSPGVSSVLFFPKCHSKCVHTCVSVCVCEMTEAETPAATSEHVIVQQHECKGVCTRTHNVLTPLCLSYVA